MGVLKKLHRALVTLDLAERGKMNPIAANALARQLIADAMQVTYWVLDDLEGEGDEDENGDESDEESFLGAEASVLPLHH